MGLLGRLFGRRDDDEDGEETPITLDLELRRGQLQRLERGLDALARAMREVQPTENPGWRERVKEYGRLAGEAMTIRQGVPTRERVLDLVFEVRPVFSGPAPAGLDPLGPLQDEVMAAADDLRELRPGERG